MTYLLIPVALIYAAFLAVQLHRSGWMRFLAIAAVCAAVPVAHALIIGMGRTPEAAAQALDLGLGGMALSLVGAFVAILLDFLWTAIRGEG